VACEVMNAIMISRAAVSVIATGCRCVFYRSSDLYVRGRSTKYGEGPHLACVHASHVGWHGSVGSWSGRACVNAAPSALRSCVLVQATCAAGTGSRCVA
jgi:hypothetical protein